MVSGRPRLNWTSAIEGSGAGVAIRPSAPKLSKTALTSLEYEVMRDDDPSGQTAGSLAGLSLAWQPAKKIFQFDVGAIGLSLDSPDIEIYTGITKRF